MRPWRYLIVNADDFGLSPGVNRGVVQAHERGIVTSASLMVRQPAAGAAAACARAHTSGTNERVKRIFRDFMYCIHGVIVFEFVLCSCTDAQKIQ